ncbi:MAG: putative porin [Deltaproteobacteria bacterium]|nr:putative porin [Deltaproteobacteria bacterium]
MTKKIVLAVCMCFLVTSATVKADELGELKRQFEQQKKVMNKMEKRIEQLESDKGTTQDLSWLKSIEWIKRVKWSGDIRYRHEYIDDETEATNHRNRHRIRARLKMKAKVNDQVDATVRIATGSSDSPTSTNQTLDMAFSSHPIWLDQAFADYHPDLVPGLHVLAGKMSNPFYKVGGHQLFWDGDVTPEGGAITYTHGFFNGQTTVNVNTGGFWVDERNAGPSVDTSLWGAQVYVKQKLPYNMHLIGGTTYYDFGSIENRTVAGIGFNGNTQNAAGNYMYDYNIIEGFGEFGIKVFSFPIAVYGAYLNNIAATSNKDSAWITGVKFGKAKKPGSFQIAYDYREVDSDAVVGGFCDSDFAGGMTDSRGYKISAKYQLMKNWQLGLTYFHNEMNSSTTEDELNLLQADLIFKF